MSQINTNAILDASGGTTATVNGYTPTVSNMAGRNRIINGAMMIDQRNAGASVSAGDGTFTVDRFLSIASSGAKGNWQQNAGAVTPPTGFVNYVGFTTTSAYSVGSGDTYTLRHKIEGLNMADFGWGSSSASPVTLSFWVRSSLTGTFAGGLWNNAQNRSFPFSYTVNSANTWEQKSITIAGDTTGTWLTTNGVGCGIDFSIGAGATQQGTANAWQAGYKTSVAGATSVVGTSGATFYITGVQLEAGSVATPFEHRQYGQELALCQRYYWKSGLVSESIGATGYMIAGNAVWSQFCFPVTMRATPTVTVNGTWAVSNTGQPTIRASSQTNFMLQIIASGTGIATTYPNTSDDYLAASIEL